MKRLAIVVVLGMLGCGPKVSKYTVPARLDGESINAIHEWEQFGERFRGPSVRNVQPSIEELNKFVEAAGWTTHTERQSCFAVISFQLKSLRFADNLQNSNPEVTDWSNSKHKLVTASGTTLVPLDSPKVSALEELVVTYDSFDNATGQWIPAEERYDRSAAEVCFETPTALAQEPWVRWAYSLPNNTRSEFTFQIQAQ